MGILATLTGLRILRFIFRIVALLVLVVTVYLAVTAVQVWQTGRRYDPQAGGAIVVMGAAQYNGVPSPDLASRLNQAETLWHHNPAATIMVTGSKESGDRFTEAQASARYLLRAGIPGRYIFESGGSDSWHSLSQAAPALLARGDRTVMIVTDPFHEARSLAIASSVGLAPHPTPTRTSPIRGWSTVPYYAKETVGVALGRIIGYQHVSQLHTSFG